MEKEDIVEEIIDRGKRCGKLTYDEINDAVPSEYFSTDELEELIDLLHNMGIEVVDDQDPDITEEEVLASEEEEVYEKTEDIVQAYFHSLGNISILKRDEEIELAKRLEEGKKIINEKRKHDINSIQLNTIAKEVQNEYKRVESEVGIRINELKATWDRITKARILVSEAKNELITRNLRLVVNVTKNYTGRGLSLLDLIQEGNIGLMKAIDKFDYKKGFKFSTYATWWIRQGATRALIDQAKTIRVPVHAADFYNKVTKASRELTQQLGREPSKEEIAKKLEVSTGKVEEIFRAIQDPIALQAPLGDEGSTIEEFISDKDSPTPYSDTERNNVTKQILKVLKTLTPREAEIIRMRFGIGFDKDHTLEEVGRQFSITRERVRQIEAKAIRKLRHPSRRNALKVLID